MTSFMNDPVEKALNSCENLTSTFFSHMILFAVCTVSFTKGSMRKRMPFLVNSAVFGYLFIFVLPTRNDGVNQILCP